MSKKEEKGRAKLSLPAGKATAGPPVGPSLSAFGINIKKFCDDFNNMTKDKMGYTIPVEIVVYSDRSFELILKQPLMSSLILKSLSADKGSSAPGSEEAGTLTKEKIDQIVKVKMPDLNTVSEESARKMVAGTAKSMGIRVEE